MALAAGGIAWTVERFFEFSLLGLLASSLLAVWSSGCVDVAGVALIAAGLLLRGLTVTGLVRFQLGRPWLAVLAAGGLAFYPVDWALLSGGPLAASLHLGLFLTACWIVAMRTGRDHTLLAVLAFAGLVVASWLSTTLYFFAALAAFLLFGVAAFASAEIRHSSRRARRVARSSARRLHWRLGALSASLAAGILLLTGGLFFVLPRTAQAAFRRLAPQRFRPAGLSEEVTLGRFGQALPRDTVVMRVRFYSEQPAFPLKWRGQALGRFDGRRWYNPAEPGQPLASSQGLVKLAENRQLWRSGHRMAYEVWLEPALSDMLFLAGTPEFLRIDAPAVIRTAGGGLRPAPDSPRGLRYGAYSFLETGTAEPGLAAPAPGEAPPGYLELPPLDARIAELARQVTEGRTSEEERAQALEQHLHRHYTYSWRPGLEQAPDPLVDFLFRRRAGHCEHFASAMAVMLRLVGIPSRVSTGFQGGAFNPISGWQVIRASDAHTWVEAWIGGQGWATFDPTPPRPRRAGPSLGTRLAWYLDAAETFWNEWVLHYDLGRQLALASKMESSGRNLSSRWLDRARAKGGQWKAGLTAWGRRYGLVTLAAAALAVAALLLAPRIRAQWRARRRLLQAERGRAQPSDATVLYARLLRLLERRGLAKPVWLTPAEFARGLPTSPAARLVAEFTRAYNHLRFGGRREAAAHMFTLLDQLEQALRQPGGL